MDYDKLYSAALEHTAVASGPWSTAKLASVATTLSSRLGRSNGLSVDEAALLLATVRNLDLRHLWPEILSAAATLRRRTYGNREQLQRHFHSHEDYFKVFAESGLAVVSDTASWFKAA